MFDKIKQLSKDTAIYGISTMIGRFLNFLLVPLYTNVFSTADFGIYTNIYAYIAFLNIVYIYGMDAAFMKYASLDESATKKIFSNGFLFVGFTSVLLTALLLVFQKPAAEVMLIPHNYFRLFYYVVFILFFDTISMIPFSNLRLQRKSVKFAVIKTGNIVVNLALNLILIFKFGWGIEAIFFSNLAASILTAIVLLPEIIKYLELRFEKESLLRMLKFGIPYLPASVAAMIVQVIDRPVMMLLTNESTVGIYQANYKLGIFMMLFVMMFQYAWQPFFLTNAKEKNAKEIFAKVLTLFLIVAATIWVIVSLFISDVASFEFWNGKTLIGKDFLVGIHIVPIILLAYLFHGMFINFMPGLYIKEKTQYFPFITAGGAAINVVSNLLLIPIYGITGAAFATLFSYIFMSIALFFTSRKFYRINYEYAKIFKIFFIILCIGSLYYFLMLSGNLNFMYKIGLVVLHFALLAGLKVIKISEIQNIAGRLIKS